MSLPDPLRALAAGTRVVTPNNRLARALTARHDAAMIRAGKVAWAASRVLPWGTWIAELWRQATDAGAVSARLVSPVESRYLWQRIVAEDATLADRISDGKGVAELAAQAWTLVHAWGAGGPSWRAWRDTALAPAGSDPEAFARWAERYQRELAQRDAVDAALAADGLVGIVSSLPASVREPVVLAGFLERAPQQQRLIDALRAAGVSVTEAAEPAVRRPPERVVGPTPRDEVVLALQWARDGALRSPGTRVGVAVNGLAARREEVRSIADEVLCPSLQLPGHEHAPRPYDLSLGAPLADHPVVAAALGWLALAHGPLERTAASALVRSPFGPGPWSARAALEKTWIEHGPVRLGAAALAAALDPASGARLRDAIGAVTLTRTRSPRDWTLQWRVFLSRCGWPGDASLPGPLFEAQQAFAGVLDDFQRLDGLGIGLAPAAALSFLRDLASSTIFQPQGQGGPVAIMGLLEAASLDFDALWIAGLSGQDWPPAPQPNPLLPLAWQREREVPRSSAPRELRFARRVTERLLRAAPDVVVSAPAVLSDSTARPTALLEGPWPQHTRPDAMDSAQRIAARRVLELVRDPLAPALDPGRAPGGTGAIAAQSDCPFKAVAQYRLRAEPWPVAPDGLSPLDRGTLAHGLMAAFWADVRSHDAFTALDPAALTARIDAAAARALADFPAQRWTALPPVIAAAERERLPGVAAEWLEAIERPRSGFVVERIEAPAAVDLAGLTFRLTLDRVDALAGGGYAIIDYKTGVVDGIKAWFDARPRAPQLGVYLRALQDEAPPLEVRAMAYGRLKAGEIGVVGLAADKAQWPALAEVTKATYLPDWGAVETFFAQRLPALAQEMRDGVATITPRRGAPSPCRICARQSLCRIGAVRGGGDGDAEDSDDGS